VTNLPLAFWGWSASAGFGSTFAEQYPERTLGFIRVRTHQRELPVNLDIIKGIPGLFMAATQDQTAGVEDAQALWKGGRTIGAPWTLIVEPHVPHGLIDGPKNVEFVSNANQLMIPWLTEVIRQRLPQAGTALRPISDRAGWVGDNRTGEIWRLDSFSGSKLDKTWLPDESSARAWQRLRLEENPSRPFGP
jgi:hypothetical protein